MRVVKVTFKYKNELKTYIRKFPDVASMVKYENNLIKKQQLVEFKELKKL